jgi:hypothetical protein
VFYNIYITVLSTSNHLVFINLFCVCVIFQDPHIVGSLNDQGVNVGGVVGGVVAGIAVIVAGVLVVVCLKRKGEKLLCSEIQNHSPLH